MRYIGRVAPELPCLRTQEGQLRSGQTVHLCCSTRIAASEVSLHERCAEVRTRVSAGSAPSTRPSSRTRTCGLLLRRSSRPPLLPACSQIGGSDSLPGSDRCSPWFTARSGTQRAQRLVHSPARARRCETSAPSLSSCGPPPWAASFLALNNLTHSPAAQARCTWPSVQDTPAAAW